MRGTPPTHAGTLDEVLGFEALDVGPELARARAEVQQVHKQPFGLVHGGVYAAMAEWLASTATYEAVAPDGKIALGLSNLTSFMRPILSGHVNAEAHRRHAGSTTWVWDVEMTDDEGRLCALSRMTVAVRPAPKR
ncbi:MAG: 1,4-dihydroxy-2-naphthoyl-CoA hydrolase [Thermoleophilaceae bacterium]|nr:1,4-dihydroxy-2-naphthoyl-CoA hydrolase [Thermoleophilaceae bacterium]